MALLRPADEVSGDVPMTCRNCRVTARSFYVWKRRYEETRARRLE